MYTTKQAVMDHVRAMSPVGIASIRQNARAQASDYNVKTFLRAIMELQKEGFMIRDEEADGIVFDLAEDGTDYQSYVDAAKSAQRGYMGRREWDSYKNANTPRVFPVTAQPISNDNLAHHVEIPSRVWAEAVDIANGLRFKVMTYGNPETMETVSVTLQHMGIRGNHEPMANAWERLQFIRRVSDII